ncbi:MAG TPA: Ig domain-containing protein [Terriglobia bacterium]|nr:Ig domain-containing protein [Terriglobia bacterium]
MQKTRGTDGVLLAAFLFATSSVAYPQKPVISSISPAATVAGEAGLSITVRGSNFAPGDAVLWNGLRRSLAFINSNQLQMTVAASDLAAAGQASIQITNPSGASNTVYFVISAPAGITITTPSLPNGTAGALYSTPLAAAGGTPPYNWSSVPLLSGLTLSASGALSGTIASPGSYLLVIRVSDATSLVATRTYSLQIDLPSGLSIATQTLPNGTAGTPYQPIVLAASGGRPPLTWSIVKGKLPPGMTLSSTGTLGGTPVDSAVYSFAVQVTDSAKNTGVLTYSLTILAP